MIITILALGGTLLGATTVAGLLTLYQIRNSTDLANSAKAIFAADAGLEWGLYNFSCANGGSQSVCPLPEILDSDFSNSASVRVVCLGSGEILPCTGSAVNGIRSIGSAGGSSRAFEASF